MLRLLPCILLDYSNAYQFTRTISDRTTAASGDLSLSWTAPFDESCGQLQAITITMAFQSLKCKKVTHRRGVPGLINVATLILGFLALVFVNDSYAVQPSMQLYSRTVRYQREMADLEGRATENNRTVYVITSTHTRSAQPPDMTRMAQTLRLVDHVHWIVVENTTTPSEWLQQLLAYNGLNHTLMTCRGATGARLKNCGLMWLREMDVNNGVFYFADDSNSYDYRLFDQVRKMILVGVFSDSAFWEDCMCANFANLKNVK